MESLSEHKRTLLTAKIAKIKLKVNLYIAKIALQSEAAQAKKIRTNFESEDVMRLLDARRLLDHQFTQKTINSAGTKDNMVAEKFNQGFAALPKGGYGVPFEENEITVIYGPLPPERQMTSPQLHDKFQKMCKSSRDIMLKLVLCRLRDSEGTARSGLSKYRHIDVRATL